MGLDSTRPQNRRSHQPDEFRRELSNYDQQRGRDSQRRANGNGRDKNARPDSEIRADILELLNLDGFVDASGMEVEVSEGVLTLRGRAAHNEARQTAEDLAASVRGVIEVRNRLELESEEGADLPEEVLRATRSRRDLLLLELRDLYDASRQFADALVKMIAEVETDLMRDTLTMLREQSRRELQRLERVFAAMGRPPERKASLGMRMILEEAASPDLPADARAAKMLLAARRARHYQIVLYGSIRDQAAQLELPTVTRLVSKTISEQERVCAEVERRTQQHLAGMAPVEQVG